MHILYIDESGKNNLTKIEASRPHFSLAGLIIQESDKENFKILADQIKFKYWDDTSVVLHAKEMKHLAGIFYKLRKNSQELSIENFQKDLLRLLYNAPIKFSTQCINKFNFIKSNPPVAYALDQLHLDNRKHGFARLVRGVEEGLVKTCSKNILISYLSYLMSIESSGKVVVEATGDIQDVFIFKVYNDLLSQGCGDLDLKNTTIRKYFTSISFVTKNNYDIETQIADLCAYCTNCEARIMDGLDENYCNDFERKIMAIVKSKTFDYQKKLFGDTYNSCEKLY